MALPKTFKAFEKADKITDKKKGIKETPKQEKKDKMAFAKGKKC
jgi:hypothetical protein